MKLKRIAIIAVGALLIGCGKGQATVKSLDCSPVVAGAVVTYNYKVLVCDGENWVKPDAISSTPTPESTPAVIPNSNTIIVCFSPNKDGVLASLDCTEVK